MGALPSRSVRSLAVLALAALLAAGRPARAGGPGDDPDVLLDEGSRLFAEEADYEGALSRFRRSHELRPSWRALNGIALVLQQQGRYVDALETYERLQAEFGAALTVRQLETVNVRVAELERRVAVVALDVPQAGAVVLLDGQEVGRGPLRRRLRVLPGRHSVVASLAGHKTFAIAVAPAAGQTVPASVVLEPDVPEVRVVVARPKVVRRFPPWVPWATLGGGVAVAAAGGILRWDADRDFDAVSGWIAAESGAGLQPVTLDAAHQDLLERGELKRDAAVGCLIAGGAAIVTGTVMLVLNGPRLVERRPPPRIVPLAGGAALQVDF